MKIVVLVSGGMDSTILHHFTRVNYPNADIVCLHYDYGHPFEHKERLALPKDTVIRKFEWMNPRKTYDIHESSPVHLPGRDFAMIAQAMIQENPDKIFLGLLHGEMELYLDQTFEFYHRLNHLLSMVSPTGKRVEVETPLEACGMNKIKAVKWALDNGMTLDELNRTSSCMHHEKDKCGVCPVCKKRWAVFTQLGYEAEETKGLFSNADALRDLFDSLNVFDLETDEFYIPALKKYFKTDDLDKISEKLSILMLDASSNG